MCGIAGILSPDPQQRDCINQMARALEHRGPDDEGYYQQGAMVLAQTRLSIIDLETGHQPILNEDETLPGDTHQRSKSRPLCRIRSPRIRH